MAKNLRGVMQGTNWAMLDSQKGSLAYTIAEAVENGNTPRVEMLAGLLHWIDAIQDAVVEEQIARESTVFPGVQQDDGRATE